MKRRLKKIIILGCKKCNIRINSNELNIKYCPLCRERLKEVK